MPVEIPIEPVVVQKYEKIVNDEIDVGAGK